MDQITVRKINFDLPEQPHFDPIYMADSAAISYRFTAIGLFVAYLEPAMVIAMRRVLKQIDDDKLRSDVDKFCRQEAHHYAQHRRFNQLILDQDYPGLEPLLQRLKQEFDDFAKKPEKFMIGYMEGFESYTTQSALDVISSGIFEHPKTSKEFADLFKWHMLEEIEHRNVAYDLYQNLYGGYFYRAKMCWFAQQHMNNFLDECAKIMSDHDVKRHGQRHQMAAAELKLFKSIAIKTSLKSMLPSYTPHKYHIPAHINQLSAAYSAHEKRMG